jgi:hypothetical protein
VHRGFFFSELRDRAYGYNFAITSIDPMPLGVTHLIMKYKSILSAALLVFAFACDDGDNVSSEQTSLLTLSVDASYNSDLADNWIIVHGENGTVLAFESTSTTFYTQSPPFESMVDSDFSTGQEPNGLQLGIKIITK